MLDNMIKDIRILSSRSMSAAKLNPNGYGKYSGSVDKNGRIQSVAGSGTVWGIKLSPNVEKWATVAMSFTFIGDLDDFSRAWEKRKYGEAGLSAGLGFIPLLGNIGKKGKKLNKLLKGGLKGVLKNVCRAALGLPRKLNPWAIGIAASKAFKSMKSLLANAMKSMKTKMNGIISQYKSSNGSTLGFMGGGFIAKKSSLDKLKDLVKKGEIKGGKNIINKIDDNTQVIFRKDTGKNAHEIEPLYMEKVDHYNIEIQTKTPAGKWKRRESYHLIIDKNGNVINKF